MRNAFIDTILDRCGTRDDIFVISGDAGLGVFDRFKEEFPDRFLNLGAAEQNMISFAAGLALTGQRAVVYNIIPFLLYRCYEQVRNDICYQELPVILAGIGSGLTYAPQGMTHYSVEDLGIARTLPNLAVLSPCDPVEARHAAAYALAADRPVYVRLAKRGEPQIHAGNNFDITEPQILRQGDGVALVCHGSATIEAMKAAELLAERDVSPMVVSLPLLQPLDPRKLAELLQGFGITVSVEEHYCDTGLGGMLARMYGELGLDGKLLQCGVPHRFIHEVFDNSGMRRAFGLDANAIAKAVLREKGADPWEGC